MQRGAAVLWLDYLGSTTCAIRVYVPKLRADMGSIAAPSISALSIAARGSARMGVFHVLHPRAAANIEL